MHLPYTFNIKSTSHLIEDLNNIPYSQNLKLASFDTANMYTNILTNDLIDIIDMAYQNNYIDKNLKQKF
jgi:hypothetical protein